MLEHGEGAITARKESSTGDGGADIAMTALSTLLGKGCAIGSSAVRRHVDLSPHIDNTWRIACNLTKARDLQLAESVDNESKSMEWETCVCRWRPDIQYLH